jgi:hypothetical protein
LRTGCHRVAVGAESVRDVSISAETFECRWIADLSTLATISVPVDRIP